jgi:mRNA interferase YafQ
MRTIEQSVRFKRDLKRESKSLHSDFLKQNLVAIVQALAQDEPLPEKYRDHALTGDWRDHRNCHLKPDLVLIYQKPNDAILRLVRLGSHSELSL